jgi:hypothetical protein
MARKMSNYIIQDKNKIIAKQNCSITINLEEYESKDSYVIDYENNIAWFQNLISVAEFDDFLFNIILFNKRSI